LRTYYAVFILLLKTCWEFINWSANVPFSLRACIDLKVFSEMGDVVYSVSERDNYTNAQA